MNTKGLKGQQTHAGAFPSKALKTRRTNFESVLTLTVNWIVEQFYQLGFLVPVYLVLDKPQKS